MCVLFLGSVVCVVLEKRRVCVVLGRRGVCGSWGVEEEGAVTERLTFG